MSDIQLYSYTDVIQSKLPMFDHHKT